MTIDMVQSFMELSPEVEVIISRYKPRFTEDQLERVHC